MYKQLTLLAASMMALIPQMVEATPAPIPITDGQVEVESLVDYFDGQRILNRNEQDKHYAEYLFDGNSLRRYEKEIVLWLNGEAVPYGFEYVEGIRVPMPGRQVTLARGFTLPAEFFEYFYGYSIEGEWLVVDDRMSFETGDNSEETPSDDERVSAEETPQPPGVESDNDSEEKESESDVNPDVPSTNDQDEDNTHKQEKEPESGTPNKTQPVHNPTDDKKEQTDKTPTQPDDNDDAPEIVEPPVQEDEPEEVGRESIELDRADYGYLHTKDKQTNLTVAGESFAIHFQDERTIAIEHKGTDQIKRMEIHKGINQSFKFDMKDGDYITLTINVVDTRPAGLTERRVRERIGVIHPDIVISVDEKNVHVYFEHIEFNLREQLFKEMELSLVLLGIQRFQLNRESGRWDIWFNLYDSDWG